jgi:hypothetical protein
MDKVKSLLYGFSRVSFLRGPMNFAKSDLVVVVEAKIRSIPPTMKILTARLQPIILGSLLAKEPTWVRLLEMQVRYLSLCLAVSIAT